MPPIPKKKVCTSCEGSGRDTKGRPCPICTPIPGEVTKMTDIAREVAKPKPKDPPPEIVVPSPMKGEPRAERLAISIVDLDRLDPSFRHKVVNMGILDLKNPATAKEIKDEIAIVPFGGDLLQCAVVCDIIRNEDRKAERTESRIYLRKEEGKSWRNVGKSTILTILTKEGTILNPVVFPPKKLEWDIPEYSPIKW